VQNYDNAGITIYTHRIMSMRAIIDVLDIATMCDNLSVPQVNNTCQSLIEAHPLNTRESLILIKNECKEKFNYTMKKTI
jgi:hypothetical protein